MAAIALAAAAILVAVPGMASAATPASPSHVVAAAQADTAVPRAAALPQVAPAVAAQAAPRQCTGNLTFGRLLSCPSVTPDQPRVYQFTTTVPNDTVFIDLHQPNSPYTSAGITAADGSWICYVTSSYPGSCTFPKAGTYTLTVTTSVTDGPGFTISVESALTTSKCTDVPASVFSMSSAGLNLSIPAGIAALCLSFSQPTGSVLWIANQAASGYPSGEIYDAQNQPLCPVSYSGSNTCTLSTAGPYKLFLHEMYGNAATYHLQMPRLSQSTGCAALNVAPFGNPGSATATASVSAAQTFACQKVHVAAAGAIGVRFSNQQQVYWKLYNAAGAQVCEQYFNSQSCPVPSAGNYTLLTVLNGFGTQTFTVAVTGEYSDAGCASATGTAWDAGALLVHQTSPVEVDCHPFTGSAGDRILTYSAPTAYNDASAWIVDATGNPVCPGYPADGQDGCVLPASGTYRVVSYLSSWDAQNPDETYQLQIRRLNNPVGCPSAQVGTYGSAPALGTIRCRILSVPAAGPFAVAAVDSQNNQLYGQVYDTSGLKVCTTGVCTFPAAGSYTLVLDGSAPHSVIDNDLQYAVSFLPAVPTGCGTVDDSASPLAPHNGSLAPGQQDCVQLPTAAGARVMELLPASATGTARPTVTLLDSAGNYLCDPYSLVQYGCALTGTAPFYAVISASNGSAPGAYSVALARVDGPPSCPTLPATADGATVTTSAGNFAACLSIPATGHATTATFTYTRTSGSGGATIQVLNSAGYVYCERGAVTDTQTFSCPLPDGPLTVLLSADSTDATYQLTYTP